MNPKRAPVGLTVVASVFVGVAVVIVVVATTASGPTPLPTASTAAALAGPWFLDRTAPQTFSLAWRSEQALGEHVPGQTVGGSAELRGTLQLQALDSRTIRMNVVDVEAVGFRVLGTAMLQPDDVTWLLSHDVSLHLDPQGRLSGVGAAGASRGMAALLSALAGDLQMPAVPDAKTMTTTTTMTTATTTTRGRGPVAGVRDGNTVTWRRDAYDTLTGADSDAPRLVEGLATATLEEGTLVSASGDEVVAVLDEQGEPRDVLRSTFHLEPRGEDAWVRHDPALALVDPPQTPRSAPAADPMAVRAELLSRFDLLLFTGFASDGHATFRAVVNALVADDSLVEDVASRFARGGRSRQSVVDVLVAAGTPAAQAALLRLLSIPPLDPDLLERLAHLPRVEPGTLTLLSSRVTSVDPAMADRARLALGALAGRGATDPRAEVQVSAAQARRQLRDLVDAATTPAARALALRAVGNTGVASVLDDDDTDRVLRFVSDDDERVRAAAASALRKAEGDEAMAALLGLAGDPVTSVQASALSALTGHVDDHSLAVLRALAEAGAVDGANVGAIMALLRTRLDDPDARATLLAVVADSRTDAFSEGMARDLLDNAAALSVSTPQVEPP